MGNKIYVGDTLHVFCKKLEKTGVIDGMVIIMAGVHIQ